MATFGDSGPMAGGSASGRSDGEYSGVGSSYSAGLDERVNKANTRNRGPSGDKSLIGSLPSTTESSRHTARVR